MGLKEALNMKVDFIIKSDENSTNIMITPAGYIFRPKIEIEKKIMKIIDVKPKKLIEDK